MGELTGILRNARRIYRAWYLHSAHIQNVVICVRVLLPAPTCLYLPLPAFTCPYLPLPALTCLIVRILGTPRTYVLVRVGSRTYIMLQRHSQTNKHSPNNLRCLKVLLASSWLLGIFKQPKNKSFVHTPLAVYICR